MPGLGTSYGRGGATTNQMDVRFADSVLIMGSNMAECHPVSFRFVMQAKLNGAKVIHAIPDSPAHRQWPTFTPPFARGPTSSSWAV